MIYSNNANETAPDCASNTRACCRGHFHRVLCFLFLVFVLALGLILGAVFYTILLPVLAAVIAFAAAVLVLILALLIYRCRRGA